MAIEIDSTLKDQMISKLKGTDSSTISYPRILQFYDLYKFMLSRETNYNVDDQIAQSYRPTMNTNFKSMANLINFLWIKIGKFE